jgi:hypothetical protein
MLAHSQKDPDLSGVLGDGDQGRGHALSEGDESVPDLITDTTSTK